MCEACGWEEYADKIKDLIDDGRYEFALDTLEGIGEWVEAHSHITDKQITAVDNIEGSRE